MKKTFLAALFTLYISLLFAGTSIIKCPLQSASFVDLSKPVDITSRASTGAMVRIIGTVAFSLSPANISSFSGTVTVSGGTGMTGTMVFSVGGKVLNVAFDTQDIKRVKSVRWSGNTLSAAYVALLNETSINDAIVSLFNTFA